MAGLELGQVAIVVAVLTAIVVLLSLWSLQLSSETKQLRRRLGRVAGRWADRAAGDEGLRSVRRATGSNPMPMLDRLARMLLPKPELLREKLRRTGKELTIGNYAAICLGVAIFLLVARMLILPMPLGLALLLSLAGGIGLPHLWLNYMIGRRQRLFIARFPEAIDMIVRGLKSGLLVTESVRAVGEEFDGPVGEEFRNVADRVRLGQPLEEALKEAAKRIALPEMQFFMISITVQRETGGNLSETLENLSDIIRRRRQMKLKIKALSSEAKASAYIIGSLPFVMFAILFLVNPEYLSTLWLDPRGTMLIGIGFGFIAVGTGVMWKMVRFEI